MLVKVLILFAMFTWLGAITNLQVPLWLPVLFVILVQLIQIFGLS